MKNLLKSKIFIGAFLLTYFLFFTITIYLLEIKTSGFGAGSWDYGFPFTYYYSNCYGGDYVLVGLLGNIFVAGTLGAVNGIVSTFFWRNHLLPFLQKVSSKEFRAKWHI